MKWRKEQEQIRKALEKHEKSNISYFELGSKLLEVSKQGYCGRNLTIAFELVGEVNKRVFEIVDSHFSD